MTIQAKPGDRFNVTVTPKGNELTVQTTVNGRPAKVVPNSLWYGVKDGDTVLAELVESGTEHEMVKLIRVVESDMAYDKGVLFLSPAEVRLLITEALVARNYDVVSVMGITADSVTVDTRPTGQEVPRLMFKSDFD